LQHPFVDENCSSHNWKEWQGYVSSETPGHFVGDLFMSKNKLNENIQIIRTLFIEASK
jgi:hypothetical protein